jgi:hypothetical protein
MALKPTHASGYAAGQVQHVRSTCLYIATKLGDVLNETVVIGGLVPSLLIDQTALQRDQEKHVGTLDLDIGLALAMQPGPSPCQRFDRTTAPPPPRTRIRPAAHGLPERRGDPPPIRGPGLRRSR